MEPLRSISGVLGATRVQERGAGGGGRKDAEAFRRALEQETSGQPGGDSAETSAGNQPPLRTRLQQTPAADRRTVGATPRHVDVIA